MGNTAVRRRHAGFAAGIASLAMALSFTAIPADAAPPPDVDYVALGDSYTAGTGAGAAKRPGGVDCWQSSPGYVDIVGATSSIDLLVNGACHGAVLSRLSPTYDQVLYTPTVQEQIRFLISTRALSKETELVSITAGANDLGFAGVLGVCAFSEETICQEAVSRATSPDALAFLTASLVKTYRHIQAAAPNATVVVLGYPLLFEPASPFAPIPVPNQTLMNEATVLVNTAIQNAVELADAFPRADIEYVDVTALFAGHAVNTAEPWLQLSPDFTADYNFHPNQAGHQAYAAALLAAVEPAQLLPQ
jgi:lysophospholipase L1-like esterase